MSKLHVEEIFSSCMIITCWKKHQYIWLAIGFRFFVWNPFMCWFCSFLWLPEKKVRLSFIIKHFYEQSWFLFNLIKSLFVFYYFWRSQLDWQCFNDNVLWCEVFRCGTCLFKPSSLCHICHPFFPLTFIITPEKSGLQRRVFLWFMTRQKTTVIEHYITVYQGKSKHNTEPVFKDMKLNSESTLKPPSLHPYGGGHVRVVWVFGFGGSQRGTTAY